MNNQQKIIRDIAEKKIFAIIRGVPSDQIEPVVAALIAGGINLLEITFEHGGELDNTLKSVSTVVDSFRGQVTCGVGTATTIEQIHAAKAAGAQFVVSPNTDTEVIRLTKSLGLVSIPGALTPSEAVTAHCAGADYVKLFPGGLFGPSYFKAVAGVLKDIPFIAVGGVDLDNAQAFIDAGAVGFGIGNYLVDAKTLQQETLEKLTQRANALVCAIQN